MFGFYCKKSSYTPSDTWWTAYLRYHNLRILVRRSDKVYTPCVDFMGFKNNDQIKCMKSTILDFLLWQHICQKTIGWAEKKGKKTLKVYLDLFFFMTYVKVISVLFNIM